jgi:hypothetical protein
MRNFKYKTFSLICVCTVLVAVWATEVLASDVVNEDSIVLVAVWDTEALASDVDNDGIGYTYDNCPEAFNPGQQDADNDGTGDACDDDTIYGYISGEFKDGIDVNIAIVTCSSLSIIATLITDEDGYYSIGDLEDNLYIVTPKDYDIIFYPESANVQVSKH